MKAAERKEDLVWSGVTVRYGEKAALSGASGVIHPGERVALMGPSGSGKTTLCRILLGREEPTEGSVTGVPRRSAAVFQEDRLVEEATVVRNVMLVLPRRADRTLAREILVALGLENELLTVVGTLSGGMKRRVALARALAADSDLLVLDEPLTGLDAETKRRALAVIGRYAAGKTLILVTHDPADAEALGARVIDAGAGDAGAS